MSNKRAAMEMSVGTIVTIVLLMTVLVLGLVLVRTIFKGAVENVNLADQSVKDQINKLFEGDKSKKILIYPETRQIVIPKGEPNLGFGIAIRNTGGEEKKFSYDLNAVETDCGMKLTDAENYIGLGKERTNIILPPGSVMGDAIWVRFDIPDTAPPCNIRYSIEVYEGSKSGNLYSPPVDVDVRIEGK